MIMEHTKSCRVYYSQFIGFYGTLHMKCDQTRQISGLALHTNALRYCTSATGSPIIHYVKPYSESAGARDADKLSMYPDKLPEAMHALRESRKRDEYICLFIIYKY